MLLNDLHSQPASQQSTSLSRKGPLNNPHWRVPTSRRGGLDGACHVHLSPINTINLLRATHTHSHSSKPKWLLMTHQHVLCRTSCGLQVPMLGAADASSFGNTPEAY